MLENFTFYNTFNNDLFKHVEILYIAYLKNIFQSLITKR